MLLNIYLFFPLMISLNKSVEQKYRCCAESFPFFSFLVSNVGNISDNTNTQNISYDVSKLIDFPGFNVPAPHRMRDVSPTVHFKCCSFSFSLVLTCCFYVHIYSQSVRHSLIT